MPLSWPELLLELRRIDLLVAAPALGPAPAALSADSRSIVPGAMYVAIRGSQADGHRFVADAVRRGAAAVIVFGHRANLARLWTGTERRIGQRVRP